MKNYYKVLLVLRILQLLWIVFVSAVCVATFVCAYRVDKALREIRDQACSEWSMSWTVLQIDSAVNGPRHTIYLYGCDDGKKFRFMVK
jgi:hypothetical protein